MVTSPVGLVTERTGWNLDHMSVVRPEGLEYSVVDFRSVTNGTSCESRCRASEKSGVSVSIAERGDVERCLVVYEYAMLKVHG